LKQDKNYKNCCTGRTVKKDHGPWDKGVQNCKVRKILLISTPWYRLIKSHAERLPEALKGIHRPKYIGSSVTRGFLPKVVDVSKRSEGWAGTE